MARCAIAPCAAVLYADGRGRARSAAPTTRRAQVQYDNRKHFNIKHVNFRRWPRDPTRNPVKLKVPIVAINGDSVPRVKLGGYVHDIFPRGLPCLVSDAEHVPRFFVVDMRRAVGDDFRMEQLELPPGVTVRQTPEVKSQQGLVARAKRVKN